MKQKKSKMCLAGAVTAFVLLAFFAPIAETMSVITVPSQSNAHLTGRIFDFGKDTDTDGLFNFLIISVEVGVDVSGTYGVSADGFRDQYNNYFYLNCNNETYLDAGVRNVSLFFSGIAIYATKLAVAYVRQVGLSHVEDATRYNEVIYEIVLSKTYDYILFDNGAKLSGTIYDSGIDTDGDGLFNVLQIGVELNVSDASFYQVSVSELANVSGYFYQSIYVSNYTDAFLDVGKRVLNVSLYGPAIYASRAINISRVSGIYLSVFQGYASYQLDYNYYLPLGRAYRYSEFNALAVFTDRVYDIGVDSDGDLKFDYLEIRIEINVTQAGNYNVQVVALRDNASRIAYLWCYMAVDLETGLHLVNFTVYGPQIYSEQISPMYIDGVSLRDQGTNTELDRRSSMLLSTLYSYERFESHALLTGRISDMGIDADHDGLFDYLTVGTEVNITEAGRYRISADGLSEQIGNGSNVMWDYQAVENDFTRGIHSVYLNFSGPKITYYHFNPTHISISIYEISGSYMQLSYVTFPLPTTYNYTQFSHPQKDMKFDIVVYPDGTIGAGGTFNFTHMYPENLNLLTNATLGFSTSSGFTKGSANGTIALPTYMWPLNSTSAQFSSYYNNGLLDANLSASVFMPLEGGRVWPTNSSSFSLNSAYSGGLLNTNLRGLTTLPSRDRSMFPLNVTDLVVRADYRGNQLSGNITFRAFSGFPLSDVTVCFKGNKTNLGITGNLTVVYGNYYGTEVNATSLENMLAGFNRTILGPTGLVYNMTQGLLECTKLNTTKTLLISNSTEYGAIVDYNATLQGNFTGFIAKLLAQMYYPYSPDQYYQPMYATLDSALSSVRSASVVLNYYYASGIASLDMSLVGDVKALWSKTLELIPPTAPPDARTQVEAWLKIANATAYSLENFSFNASYSSVVQRLDLKGRLLANNSQLETDITQILPGIVPPQLHGIVEAYTSTKYAEVTSSNVAFNYTNGIGDFVISWTIGGDFEAQVNHAKHFYVNYMNATSPWTLTLQMRVLNETDININNFSAELRIGKDWLHSTFDGLIARPSKEEMDFVRFRLTRIFNATAGPYESPVEFEELKITVTGGSNATHTIMLEAPSGVPRPDIVSPRYNFMIWQNTSLSSLSYLLFKIAYQGMVNYAGTTFYVPIFTNSTASSFSFDSGPKRISFNVAGTYGSGFCNVTIPRTLLYASPDDWVIMVDGNQIGRGNYSVTENAEYAFICFAYSHSTHLIQMEGTWAVSEYPPHLLPLIFTICAFIATVIVVGKRRKLKTLKTSFKLAINAFESRLARTCRYHEQGHALAYLLSS